MFAEPWQASVFAMTVKLAEAGHFTWGEWAEALGTELAAARAVTPNAADTYFARWLDALEHILADKGLADTGQLAALKTAWQDAYAHTPHGQPVRLRS